MSIGSKFNIPISILLFGILILFFGNAKSVSALADSPWSMFHGDSKLTGQSQYDTSKNNGSILWKFKAEAGIETSPIIDKNGNIYIADQNCNLYSINSKGKENWRFNAGNPVTSKEWGGESCSQSTPAVAEDGTIYYLPMTGNFFALNPDGTEKWKYPIFTYKNSWTSPSIASDGTIYIGSEMYPPRETGKPEEKQAYIYALNPDGTEKWKYDTRSSWSNGTASLANDGTIYTTAGDWDETTNQFVNALIAFNQDGNVKWKFRPPNGVPEGSASIGKDGTIYIGAKGEDDPRNAFFYAVDPNDGKEIWKFDLDQGVSITPGIADDGTIYFGDWGGKFYALNPDGTEKWSVQTPEGYEVLSSSPAIGKDGTVYFGSIANEFFAYNPDGTEKWNIPFESAGIVSSPAIGSDGTVYFATVPGELYAVGEGQGVTTKIITSQQNDKPLDIFIWIFLSFAIITFLLGIFIKSKRKMFWTISLVIIILTIVGFILLNPTREMNSKTDQKENYNQSSEAKNNDKDRDNKENCPHHVYGTYETGFYGAFDMETKDLTDQDVTWIDENCTNTTWPEEMRDKNKY